SPSSEEFASRLGIHSSEGEALWLQFIQLMSFVTPAKIAFFPRTLSASPGWSGETSRSFRSPELLCEQWKDFVNCVRSCLPSPPRQSPTTSKPEGTPGKTTGDFFALEFLWTVSEGMSYPLTTRIRLSAKDGRTFSDSFALPLSDRVVSSLLKTASSITSNSREEGSLSSTALTLCS